MIIVTTTNCQRLRSDLSKANCLVAGLKGFSEDRKRCSWDVAKSGARYVSKKRLVKSTRQILPADGQGIDFQKNYGLHVACHHFQKTGVQAHDILKYFQTGVQKRTSFGKVQKKFVFTQKEGVVRPRLSIIFSTQNSFWEPPRERRPAPIRVWFRG